MTEMNRGNGQQEPAAPTLRELAMVLFRQKVLFCTVWSVLIVLTVFYAVFGTSYQAHLRVLVRRGRSDPPATAQQTAAPDFSRAEVSEEELNSEVELLKDDDVLRRVVEATGLADHDWLRRLRPHEESAARVERAIKSLANRLKVASVKKTNLIAVSYDTDNPQRAAQVLQSLSCMYLEKHMQVHRPAGQLHFFDQQTAESQRQLEDAKRKLLVFTNTHGVVAAGEQRDLLLQRLDSAEGRFDQTQLQISEIARRTSELDAQIAELPQRTVTQVRTADNPELLKALKASLLDLQLKKIQLLTKFEPSHRFVNEVEQQILQTKTSISAERLTPVHDEVTDKNADFEWAKGESQKARVDLQGLQARVETATGQLIEYRRQAQQFGQDAINQEDLVSDEKAAQENYLLYVRKREEARMGDAFDEGGIVNVAIAQQPVVPALPVWSAASVVLIGFLVACTLGTAAAFTADYFDPALRTPEEVIACLELPVLASLPARNGPRLSA